jgi:hypothetical protein
MFQGYTSGGGEKSPVLSACIMLCLRNCCLSSKSDLKMRQVVVYSILADFLFAKSEVRTNLKDSIGLYAISLHLY